MDTIETESQTPAVDTTESFTAQTVDSATMRTTSGRSCGITSRMKDTMSSKSSIDSSVPAAFSMRPFVLHVS